MSRFWLFATINNDYLSDRRDWVMTAFKGSFDTYEIAVLDAQWRYNLPQTDGRWINYARILEVEGDRPIKEWVTPNQPIDDGLSSSLEFSADGEYGQSATYGIPEYWTNG